MDKKVPISMLLLFSLIIFACGLQSVPAKQKPSNFKNGEMQLINELFTKNNLTLINLKSNKIITDEQGSVRVLFDQYYNDLLVFPADIVYHFNKEGGLTLVSGNRIDVVDVSTNPSISEQKAFVIAKPELINLDSTN